MINLRYHIVSITAVFLALGIGIAMGSSFLGAAAVDRVEGNIRATRQAASDARTERDGLQAELDRRDETDAELLEDGSETLFANDLTDVPVVIVSVGGVDDDSLDALRSALESSRAQYEGDLRVNDKVVEEGAAEELAEVLGEPDLTGLALQTALVDAVAAELLDHGVTVDGEAPEAAPPVTTRDLTDAGFFDWEQASNSTERDQERMLASSGYRYVVVTGVEPDVPDAGFLLPLLQAMTVDGPAPVVVASAATGADAEAVEANRELPLAFLREDGSINDRVSTVDDLETLAGIAAVLRTLEDLAGPERGHYGVGEGRDSLLPEP